LKGSRSGLFYEYKRILEEVKPKYFILENVNSMPKEAKQIITAELFFVGRNRDDWEVVDE
jgi:site-specific DNA-cytosine methylase